MTKDITNKPKAKPRGKAFPKGNAGRPVGAVGKRTKALAACEAAGLDPFAYLVSVVKDVAEKTDLRLKAAAELCEYLEPKLSRQELKTTDEEGEVRGFILIPARPKKEGE